MKNDSTLTLASDYPLSSEPLRNLAVAAALVCQAVEMY